MGAKARFDGDRVEPKNERIPSSAGETVIAWTPRRVIGINGVALSVWAMVAASCLFVSSEGTLSIPDVQILGFRLERVLLASLVGAALAAAGTVYQAVLRNPLADPFLLGVASGATLGIYCWKIPAIATAILSLNPILASASQPAFAFFGAVLTVLIVFALSARDRAAGPTLILAGVILNTIVGAVLLLIYTLFSAQPGSGYFQALLVGDLQTNLTGGQIAWAATLVGACFLFMSIRAGKLNAMSLADDEARSTGIAVGRLRWQLLISASLMTAAAVAVSGPIGFVGLLCPHAARWLAGGDHRRLLPLATALGAVLLCLADATARLMLGLSWINTMLPLGVLTALLAGPAFFVLLHRTHRREALS
jgi:iron complex transport system permease protein